MRNENIVWVEKMVEIESGIELESDDVSIPFIIMGFEYMQESKVIEFIEVKGLKFDEGFYWSCGGFTIHSHEIVSYDENKTKNNYDNEHLAEAELIEFYLSKAELEGNLDSFQLPNGAWLQVGDIH